MLGITCDLGFRARGFRFGTGFGAWGLRFRLVGFRDYRVQGLGLRGRALGLGFRAGI